MTSKQWDRLVETTYVAATTSQFATRQVSGREFVDRAILLGVGGPARSLVDTYGVDYGRNVARKALKRRGVLTSQNLFTRI